MSDSWQSRWLAWKGLTIGRRLLVAVIALIVGAILLGPWALARFEISRVERGLEPIFHDAEQTFPLVSASLGHSTTRYRCAGYEVLIERHKNGLASQGSEPNELVSTNAGDPRAVDTVQCVVRYQIPWVWEVKGAVRSVHK